MKPMNNTVLETSGRDGAPQLPPACRISAPICLSFLFSDTELSTLAVGLQQVYKWESHPMGTALHQVGLPDLQYNKCRCRQYVSVGKTWPCPREFVDFFLLFYTPL